LTLRRIVFVTVIAAIVLVAVYEGIALREYVFNETQHLRFSNDANNGYRWGQNARIWGLFELYDLLEQRYPIRAIYDLDYTPLRLAVVTGWNELNHHRYTDADYWRRDFDFTAPMLWFNTIAALVASVFAFLLVRMWIIESDSPRRPIDQKPRPFRGVIPALVAALLLWFNPAALWDGYVWGQWEVWIIPFYLAAVYFACIDCWFIAGASIAIGAMLKPQLLVAAPVLLLWPLFELRLGALLRVAAGLALMTMLIVFPWLKLSKPAFIWYLLALSGLALLTPLALRWKLRTLWIAVCAIAALLLVFPWTSSSSLPLRMIPLALLGISALARFMSARLVPHLYAILIAAFIALTIPLHHASSAWFSRGITYGPITRPAMFQKPVYNIPSMGVTYLRWQNSTNYSIELPLMGRTTVWGFMIALQGMCLVISGIGAAIQHRNRDKRFLAAMTLPWLTFYMTLTQQQSRYLMWAATVGALLVALGPGMAVLGILIGLLGWISIHQSVTFASGGSLRDYPWIPALDPHAGWILLMITLILMYQALVPGKRAAAMVPPDQNLPARDTPVAHSHPAPAAVC
jgi:hypothetical protein